MACLFLLQNSDHENVESKSSEFAARDARQAYPEHADHRPTGHDRNVNTDIEETSHTYSDTHSRDTKGDTDDARHGRSEQEEEEEDENEDEGEDEKEDDDDDDEEDEDDRIKETQKLVAKIEHDIEGLRFQAKQRGHLLSDLHRYGTHNQQQKVEHEQTQQPATREEPSQGTDEAKIIERPVSIKLRLRTRSTSPKAQQTRFALPPTSPVKTGRVKLRRLRIGNQLARWEAWKERLSIKSDRDLAKIMLDQ